MDDIRISIKRNDEYQLEQSVHHKNIIINTNGNYLFELTLEKYKEIYRLFFFSNLSTSIPYKVVENKLMILNFNEMIVIDLEDMNYSIAVFKGVICELFDVFKTDSNYVIYGHIDIIILDLNFEVVDIIYAKDIIEDFYIKDNIIFYKLIDDSALYSYTLENSSMYEDIKEILYSEKYSKTDIIDYICKIKDYKKLHILSYYYNWDDGFEMPEAIVNNPFCDLSTAMMVFYLADGYSFLSDKESFVESDQLQWKRFIKTLSERILNNEYKNSKIDFKVPLSKLQKYKLERILDLEEMRLVSDIEGERFEIPIL